MLGDALQHARWGRKAVALAPVFIVGDARSGSSVLYRALQSHSAFTPRGGLHLTESHAMEHLPEVFGPQTKPPWPLVNFMNGEAAYGRFAEAIAPLETRRRRVRGALGEHPAAWVAAGEHHVVRRYFLDAAESRGARRLLEKTPNHVHRVKQLKVAFPRARFLFIARHPVDVYASYRRRYAVDPQRWAWAGIGVADFTERWRSNIGAARALEASRWAKLRMVRYEDLTRDPEPTVRAVLEFLGLPFEEACVAGSGAKVPQLIASADPLLQGPLTANTHDWQEHVGVDDARAIERDLADDMRAAGYAPYAAPRRAE